MVPPLNHTSPCPFPDHTLVFSKDLWARHLLSDTHLGGRDVKSAHAQHSAQTCCSGCVCAVVSVTCTVYYTALTLYVVVAVDF